MRCVIFNKGHSLVDLVQVISKFHAANLTLSRTHYNKWNDHFFHRYSAVLKGISVVIRIMVEMVLIYKILLSPCKNKLTV